MNINIRLVFLALCVVCYSGLHAQTVDQSAVPVPLQTWVDWVMWEQGHRRCPMPFNQTEQFQCAWPGKLSLQMRRTDAAFQQIWVVYHDSWVHLPGDMDQWPQNVKVNQRKVAVMEREGRPSLFLSKGTYEIEGGFIWQRLPEQLQLPQTTGWVLLVVEGKNVRNPFWDNKGQLWIKKKDAQAENVAEQIIIKVHRRLIDDIPFQMHTSIALQVSGRSREVTLGKVFAADFTPIRMHSDLPARLDKDGRLVMQVRTGKWRIQLDAYQNQPVQGVRRHAPEGEWPTLEIWGFQARHDLRLTRVTGMTQINAQELALPEAMKNLPVFQANVGETLTLTQTQRGDPGLTQDTFALVRQWYLDFDGGGYTIADQISGVAQRERRLEMSTPTQLGQVVINGRPQFITKMMDNGVQGVEVRKGNLALSAHSRIEHHRSPIPAVGWDVNMQTVRGTLHLPPGWRVLAISGVDSAQGAWVEQWTLLDIFLVLVVSVAIGRLWRWPWGVLALLTLTLSYQEADAPRWIWLYVLAAIALYRAMPVGKGKLWVRRSRNVLFLSLILISVLFFISQARYGLHPQLEQTMWENDYPQEALAYDYAEPQTTSSVPALQHRLQATLEKKSNAKKTIEQQFLDPNAKIQTGPGVPQWRWNQVALHWSGVVDANQEIQVYYLSPRVNQLLNFMRIVSTGVLLLLLLGVIRPRGNIAVAGVRHAAPLLLLACIVCWPHPVVAEMPTPELLRTLQQRLTQAPECQPLCADIPNLQLHVDAAQFRIKFTVHSMGRTAIPLPGIQDWRADKVLINGASASTIRRDRQGVRWITVEDGVHSIALRWAAPVKDSVQITFVLPPKQMQSSVTGWRIKGAAQGRRVAQIELVRTQTTGRQVPVFKSSTLPAFVEVQRTLLFGVDWEVLTTVRRLSQVEQPILLEIPLLLGESVTTDEIGVVAQKAQVSLQPGVQQVAWRSALGKQSEMSLSAPIGAPWVEVWRVLLSPIWHANFSDLPRISDASDALVWRPWPGETLKMTLTRPVGVAGETLTIDQVTLDIKPGARNTTTEASIKLRSSRGGQHPITLAQGATLQKLRIDGQNQPITQNTGVIHVPVRPGEQRLELTWSTAQGMVSHFQTATLDLGATGVNARIHVAVPSDRWVLWTAGPALGPAVLVWGVMLVLLLISIAFGRIKQLPLNTLQWILLWLGLSMASIEVSLLVVLWFFAMMWRKDSAQLVWWRFNLMQIGLALLTIVAMSALVYCVEVGLLGSPDMSIAGNGSSSYDLRWYQDRFDQTIPQASVISLPLFVYRIIMLLWALWLAYALINWLKWGWSCYSERALWRPKPKKKTASRRPANKLISEEGGDEAHIV